MKTAIGYISRWKISIKVKMVLAFLAVSVLSVLMVGGFSNYIYSDAVEKEFYSISNEATVRLNYHLDYYYRQLQQSTHSLISSERIQNWLTSPNYTNEDIQNVEKELRSYLALNYSETQGMFLISRSQPVVSMAQSFAKLDHLMNEPWYSMPLSGNLEILPTHIAKYQIANGRPVVSIFLPIFDKSTLDLIGRLVVDVSLQEIKRSFQSSRLGSTGTFFIVSQQNTIVYHPNEEWDGLPMAQTPLSSLRIPDDQSAAKQRYQGKNYLVASSRSAVTGWRIVSMVPFDEVAVGLSAARISMLVVLLLITMLVLIVVPLVTNRFIKPILTLRSLMRQVGQGDLTVQTESVTGQDEIQQLSHSFNQMVKRLDQLIITNTGLQLKEMKAQLMQKEAFIKALQNQINPHLLYNTLGIIKGMAYLEKVPVIERMARNLADVYRYTTKFTEMEVRLEEELGHLTKYLEIIHTRFPKHFQSQCFFNEKFLQLRVVKFILQPIVENAVKYAIEPRGGEGAVIVSAYDEGPDLIIEIADNGPGIEEEVLLRIREQLDEISANVDEHYGKGESLGISNVHARLVLKYGSKYGVTLTSFAGRGTVVSLRLPLAPFGSK
ncbi:sensor histidine kinase [Paenibacillus roseipurpureus]|uniref:histidine kinase n=1 Tax=Paenibacillus roseopurpureus TaxID=2918901 RepID=A0AA96RJ83_9BACL|nr:cache domain-containing protein [Paenibacillus sp. MBLB1832]WNR43024.1 cache domain-containing protein [Paenibacillus sp. MBLB1832]